MVHQRLSSKKRQAIRSIAIFLLLLFAATGIGYLSQHVRFPETNIVIVYILAILVTAMFTPFYILDVIASLIGTITFSFFFTEPYFHLSIAEPSYLITFLIMMTTALITSALTNKMKQSVFEAKVKEMEANTLYKLTSRLTDAGADDYLIKPFSETELLARIRVALRHAKKLTGQMRERIVTVGPNLFLSNLLIICYNGK